MLKSHLLPDSPHRIPSACLSPSFCPLCNTHFTNNDSYCDHGSQIVSCLKSSLGHWVQLQQPLQQHYPILNKVSCLPYTYHIHQVLWGDSHQLQNTVIASMQKCYQANGQDVILCGWVGSKHQLTDKLSRSRQGGVGWGDHWSKHMKLITLATNAHQNKAVSSTLWPSK